MQNKVNDIKSILKWQINSGVYKVGEKLPSENALAIKFNCSRITSRKVMKELKEDKLIISHPGKGYFISAGHTKLELITRNGNVMMKTTFHHGDFPFIQEDVEVFKEIGYEIDFENIKFFKFYKTQFNQEDQSFTVLHSMINENLVGEVDVDKLKISLSRFISKKGIKVARRIERIMVIEPPRIVSIKLRLQKNQKVVAAYSIMFDDKNNIIEFAIRYTLLNEYIDTFERIY